MPPISNSEASARHSKSKRRSNIESYPFKWVKQLRGLPSSPSQHDHLKIEYIDTNLNNSRKMINSVNELSNSSKELLNTYYKVGESLTRIDQIEKELDWLNNY